MATTVLLTMSFLDYQNEKDNLKTMLSLGRDHQNEKDNLKTMLSLGRVSFLCCQNEKCNLMSMHSRYWFLPFFVKFLGYETREGHTKVMKNDFRKKMM